MLQLNVNGKKLDDIELIIFDKDGTLFQLYPFCRNMVLRRAQAICEALGSAADRPLYDWLVDLMGVDMAGGRIHPQGPIGVYSRYYAQKMVRDRLRERGLEISPEQMRTAFEKADVQINSEEDMRSSILPVPGMEDFVRSLNGRCKRAILSNDVTPRLVQMAKMFGIEGCFDMIVGGDIVSRHKPDPMGAWMIMKQLGTAPETTLLIGDSALDMEMGYKAGCGHLIAVKSDITDAGLIASYNAMLVDDFMGILVS
ncbi:MAG TPA: HAD family hydrolase [Methanocella sp.]|nr:HAD family hydrolase [Methanocella sp.]